MLEQQQGAPYGVERDQNVTPPVETGIMARQLTLMEKPTAWRLDERTRETGRRGIASARAVLAEHRPDAQQHSAAA